jgi:hypothetical protein
MYPQTGSLHPQLEKYFYSSKSVISLRRHHLTLLYVVQITDGYLLPLHASVGFRFSVGFLFIAIHRSSYRYIILQSDYSIQGR